MIVAEHVWDVTMDSSDTSFSIDPPPRGTAPPVDREADTGAAATEDEEGAQTTTGDTVEGSVDDGRDMSSEGGWVQPIGRLAAFGGVLALGVALSWHFALIRRRSRSVGGPQSAETAGGRRERAGQEPVPRSKAELLSELQFERGQRKR